MITLFRRIRKQLMEQSKVTSYILYAIGEVLLVVIGILIALQVNNWNEQRKTANTEEQLLTQLQEDVELLLSELETDMAYLQRNIERTDSLIFYRGSEESEEWKTLFSQNYITNPKVFPSRATYENIKSIGLDIISNPELRNLITDLYERSLTRAEQWELNVYDYQDRIMALMEKNFKFVDFYEDEVMIAGIAVPAGEHAILMPESYEVFKSNNEIYNAMIEYQQRRKFCFDRYRDVQIMAEEIYSNLNRELDLLD